MLKNWNLHMLGSTTCVLTTTTMVVPFFGEQLSKLVVVLYCNFLQGANGPVNGKMLFFFCQVYVQCFISVYIEN